VQARKLPIGKERAVIELNDKQIPLIVDTLDEPYFREAKDILNDRLAALKSDYSAYASSDELVAVLAVEALVDALKVNERYQQLRLEVSNRLESIQGKFQD
jgi:cell division protein ZapA (FtsZ GTPase activity inhibitor)